MTIYGPKTDEMLHPKKSFPLRYTRVYLWSTSLWHKQLYTVVHAAGTLAVPTEYTNAVNAVGSDSCTVRVQLVYFNVFAITKEFDF